MLALFAAEQAPVKVGDEMIVTGYSFNGMTMLVEKVALRRGWSLDYLKSPYYFVYSGYIINKDGKPGSRYTSFRVKVKEA